MLRRTVCRSPDSTHISSFVTDRGFYPSDAEDVTPNDRIALTTHAACLVPAAAERPSFGLPRGIESASSEWPTARRLTRLVAAARWSTQGRKNYANIIGASRCQRGRNGLRSNAREYNRPTSVRCAFQSWILPAARGRATEAQQCLGDRLRTAKHRTFERCCRCHSAWIRPLVQSVGSKHRSTDRPLQRRARGRA